MSASDPMLEERLLQLLAASESPVSVRELTKASGAFEGYVWASVRNLKEQGLAAERFGGYSFVATPEGQRRGAAAIVASLDAEMQQGFQDERNAIVAAASEVMDVANADKILAVLARSSQPLSRQMLATTIGEDLDTVDELAARLVADGLVEPQMNGLSFQTTDAGRRASADTTDAEMQELFSSERDAIVASAGSLMSADTADVLWFEAAEEDRQRTGLVASVTYDPVDPWAPSPQRHQCDPERRARFTRVSGAEAALSKATEEAREAIAQFARTKSRADGDRALEATRLVRARMAALKGQKR